VISRSPHGASARVPDKWKPVFRKGHATLQKSLGLLARIAFAAVFSATLHGVAVPSAARAQASEPPPAQVEPQPEMRQTCPGLVAHGRPPALPAALRLAALNADQVRLTFIGHSTFVLESPDGVRIATDYNDYLKLPALPDIVTMNHAHDTHFSDHPDAAIKYVLRGWGPSPQEPAIWDVKYRDVRVRNVPTNIRNWTGGTERHGNSIFVFEIANLCIAHLGHLHHTLTQQQLDEIGRVDVVMAPVDGNYTLDLDGMMEVLTALKAQIIIPMHFFGWSTLERFLERAGQQWPVERSETRTLLVSKSTLPSSPKVLVLMGF
jgi:L-ascorbate metabolism protein UlaG (beta-lactamase superfamily)